MFRRPLANVMYATAHTLLALGSWTRGSALWLLRHAADLWPDHPRAGAWATYLEGVGLLQREDAEGAVEKLKRAASELSDAPAIRANLGLAQAAAGDYGGAIHSLEATFRDAPGLMRVPSLCLALAWSCLRTGQVAKAREACSQAEEHGVATPRLRLIEAFVVGMETGRMPSAAIQKTLRSVPGATPLVLDFALQLAQRLKYDLAQQLIESLPEDSRGTGYRVLAYSALNAEDLQTALWAGARCEYTTHDVGGAAMLRSEIALHQHKLPDAVTHARKAIDNGHERSEAHEQLGKALLLSGKWGPAVEQMIEALHSGRASALAAGVAALASINAGDLQTARGLFSGQRTGDGLGVAFAHVAQCHIMRHDGRFEDVLKLAAWAMDEIDEFPGWLRRAPLLRKMAEELHSALEALIAEADAAADEAAWHEEFQIVHERVSALREECCQSTFD